jgi:hypothetical protein
MTQCWTKNKSKFTKFTKFTKSLFNCPQQNTRLTQKHKRKKIDEDKSRFCSRVLTTITVNTIEP